MMKSGKNISVFCPLAKAVCTHCLETRISIRDSESGGGRSHSPGKKRMFACMEGRKWRGELVRPHQMGSLLSPLRNRDELAPHASVGADNGGGLVAFSLLQTSMKGVRERRRKFLAYAICADSHICLVPLARHANTSPSIVYCCSYVR